MKRWIIVILCILMTSSVIPTRADHVYPESWGFEVGTNDLWIGFYADPDGDWTVEEPPGSTKEDFQQQRWNYVSGWIKDIPDGTHEIHAYSHKKEDGYSIWTVEVEGGKIQSVQKSRVGKGEEAKPKIESTNAKGEKKDIFLPKGPVHVEIKIKIKIEIEIIVWPLYVVDDREWSDGDPIPPRVPGTATTVVIGTTGAASYTDLPFVESADAAGNRKDIFLNGESVYAYGRNYAADTDYPIYVVEDAMWTDGMNIPTRVAGTVETITTDGSGIIPAGTLIWDAFVAGEYDIVVDVNKNGAYDKGIDTRDDLDIDGAGFANEGEGTEQVALIWDYAAIGEYDIVVDVNENGIYEEAIDLIDDLDVLGAGFLVVPELPLGTILGIVMCLVALAVFKSKRLHVHL